MYRHIWGPTTTAIHAGRSFNATRAVTAPIVQSSVFEFNETAKEGEALARWGNPNVGEVEAVLAALERTDEALLTNSGTAAIALVLETFVGSSAHIVAPSHVSPGTWWLLQHWQETRNLRISWIEHTLDPAEWAAALVDSLVGDLARAEGSRRKRAISCCPARTARWCGCPTTPRCWCPIPSRPS